jgi:hypothetical protein
MAANTEHIFGDGLYANLASSVTASGTSFTLIPGQTNDWWQVWQASKWLIATVKDSAGNFEVVRVTAISGDVLTVVRGQESTISRAWPPGTLVSIRLTGGNLSQFLPRSFRSGAYMPHGVLTGSYTGEKFYQTGPTECYRRWFVNVGSTSWKLLAGALCGSEYYDDDGFIVVPSERWLIPTSDISLGNWTALNGGPGYVEIDNGIAMPGAAPDWLNSYLQVVGITGNYRGHLTDTGGSIVGLVTARVWAWLNGNINNCGLGFTLYTGATPYSAQYIIGKNGSQPWQIFPPGFYTYTWDWVLTGLSAAEANDLRVWIDVTDIDGGQTLQVLEVEFEVD